MPHLYTKAPPAAFRIFDLGAKRLLQHNLGEADVPGWRDDVNDPGCVKTLALNFLTMEALSK
jgi:hypothetical protein